MPCSVAIRRLCIGGELCNLCTGPPVGQLVLAQRTGTHLGTLGEAESQQDCRFVDFEARQLPSALGRTFTVHTHVSVSKPHAVSARVP